MVRSAFLLLLLAGCADHTFSPEVASRIPAPTSTIRLVEDLTVGGVDAPGSILFNRIGDISVDEDGAMYVTDWSEVTVWVVSPNGELIGQLGSRGEGPGEFRSLSGTVVVGDSVLVLADDAISVFDRQTLTHVRDHGLQTGFGEYVSGIVLVLGEDVYVRSYKTPLPSRDGYGFIAHTTLGNGSLDTLFVIDTLFAAKADMPLAVGGSAVDVDYTKGFRCTAIAQVFYCGHMGRLWFQSVSTDGTLGSVVNVDFDPLPISSADRAYYKERFAGTVFEPILELPDYWPAFREVVVADDGRLWATVRVSRDDSKTTFLRIDPIRNVSHEAAVDGDVKLEVVRGGKLYGIRMNDSTGARSLVRYAISD